MKSAFYYIIMLCLLVGCTNPGRRVVLPDSWQQDTLSYAQGLTDRNQPVPEGLPKGTVVKVPVQRVVVYTSVHASILEQLGESHRIVGVCEPRYMDSPEVRAGLNEGRIADLGEAFGRSYFAQCRKDVGDRN